MELLAGTATGLGQGTQYLGPNIGSAMDREQRGKEREAAIKEAQADRAARAKADADERDLRERQFQATLSQQQLAASQLAEARAERDLDRAERAADKSDAKAEKQRKFKLEQGALALDKFGALADKGIKAIQLGQANRELRLKERQLAQQQTLADRAFNAEQQKTILDGLNQLRQETFLLYRDQYDKQAESDKTLQQAMNIVTGSSFETLQRAAAEISVMPLPETEKAKKLKSLIGTFETTRRLGMSAIQSAQAAPDSEKRLATIRAFMDGSNMAMKAAMDAAESSGVADLTTKQRIATEVYRAKIDEMLGAAEASGAPVAPTLPEMNFGSVQDILKQIDEQIEASKPKPKKGPAIPASSFGKVAGMFVGR
jgi:hypothetical protein